MSNNIKEFSWIPFYTELAKALLRFKEDRKPLVDWIYTELSKVKGIGGKSLVEYIHNRDKSNVTDIDPFSVIAIFNRSGLTVENRINYCEKFKALFALSSEIPHNFDGIPTVFAMRAFFFHWDNKLRREYLWDLLEKVVNNQNISETFNKLLEDELPKYTLTMILYWVSPEQYLALDSRNRSFFQNYGFTADSPVFNYDSYIEIVEKARKMMSDKTIDCKTFPELSHLAWKLSQTSKLWMFNGNEKTFLNDELKMGSSAKGALKFEEFKSKTAMGDAYRKAVDNKDVTIPQMYWEFIHEVKVGDIVVVFETRKNPKPQHHVLYGWGRICSDVYYDYDDENPIIRKVEWNHPQPQEPIKETKTKNALYFHDVSGTEAANIMKLLDINGKGEVTMNNSNNDIFIQLLKTNKNLILTGAPGTGKTYMAKELARQILGLDSVEGLKNDKRFGFVQFHPSYDYTDFVEGLRPKNDDKGNIGFKRKDGVFKEFCKQAILSETADADTLDDINRNPTVWKVSLEGTGDNPTRTDCMENGYIRIGWDGYGNVEDFMDYNDFTDGGKNVLRAFQSGMQIGDLVVSCYSAKEIDAVGVIIGDYEYRPEGGSYPRYRNVKWLVKNIRENIVELNNNKAFTLPTVYKASITAEAALKIVKKYSMKADIAPRKDTAVFVIDEINRGEISKIFGELFFSIDPGYRGVKGAIKTQYQNLIEDGDAFKDGFFVPENVYIIGTMNDIDRSVESMDFAMRRRFAWKEVTAEQSYENMIENDSKFDDAAKAEIRQRMFGLNEAIEKTEGLDKSYQIGAAYFRKYLDYKGQPKPFDCLWENHLKGLLSEYLRGNRKADDLLKKLHKAYNLTSTDEQPSNNNEG